MSDKCPECGGPCKANYKMGNIDEAENMRPSYRSTAAEQLEELHAANRELIRQHKDDIRSGDIRAKAIRRGLDQLADKERKLKTFKQWADADKIELAKLDGIIIDRKDKLTAANTIVEAAREAEMRLYDFLLHCKDGDVHTAHNILVKARQQYDKFQGGE